MTRVERGGDAHTASLLIRGVRLRRDASLCGEVWISVIYLDNGATSYPKPKCVVTRASEFIMAANPGRSSHLMSKRAAGEVYGARKSVAELFGCETDEVVFTSGATAALNMAIKGLIPDGCHIITTDMEHNSVRRPLYSLASERGCRVSRFSTAHPERAAAEAERLIEKDTRALVVNHASNIVNRVLPLCELGELCEKHGLIFIVDASQSAGKYEIDVNRAKINALAAAGHKGLLGPMGSGVLIIKKGSEVRPLMDGGSGTMSLEPFMPSEFPDRLEAGTLPLPAIAGLGEGVRYVMNTGVDNIRRHEEMLFDVALSHIKHATVYERHLRGANLLFNVDGKTAAETAARLDEMGIGVRSGLHCAPDAHKSVGTPNYGAVRASFGPFTTEREVLIFARALNSVH